MTMLTPANFNDDHILRRSGVQRFTTNPASTQFASQRADTPGVADGQIDEAAAFRNFDVESPGFLREAHNRPFGGEGAIDVDVKAHTRVGGQKAGVGALAEGLVIDAGQSHEAVIAAAGRAHAHALGVGRVANAERWSCSRSCSTCRR
jgi:hypothetical protein